MSKNSSKLEEKRLKKLAYIKKYSEKRRAIMKKCSACGETKPGTEFWRDNAASDGFVSKCKKCSVENRISNKNAGKFAKSGSVAILPNFLKSSEVDADLSLLLQVKRERAGWTYQQALGLMSGITEAGKTGMIDFERVFARHGSGYSNSSCYSLLKELKRAAENKLSLKEYWQKGRPYRIGNKVVYKGKKNEKS